MSGIGYSWVRRQDESTARRLRPGLLVQQGHARTQAAPARSTSTGPVAVDVEQLAGAASAGQGGILPDAKFSLRTQLSYTYTDPDVVDYDGARSSPGVAAASRQLSLRWASSRSGTYQYSTGRYRRVLRTLCSAIGAQFSSSNSSSSGRPEARRRAQRFAIVVERQARDVARVHAARRLRLEHDEHRAAGQAFAKREAATASETSVCESLQHVR